MVVSLSLITAIYFAYRNAYIFNLDHDIAKTAKRTLDTVASEARMAYERNAKIVIMGICDQGYFDIVLNYQIYARKLGLKTLFVSLDRKTHEELSNMNLSSFYYEKISDISKTESKFGSYNFNLKGAVKFEITLELIRLGYHVLLVDFDVIFLKNPLPVFDCHNCDIEGQNERGKICVGIVFTRNTSKSIRFYRELVSKLHSNQGIWDQPTFNKMLKPANVTYGLNYRLVNTSLLQHGATFFYEHFLDANAFSTVIAYHNNYALNSVQKMYRAKELGLWMLYHNGYYSSKENKYVAIEFPEHYSRAQEMSALQNVLVLTKYMGRVLILPKFKCPPKNAFKCSKKPKGECFCSIAEITNIEAFHRLHKGQYREHTFLHHPNVPNAIKTSTSPFIYINVKSDRIIWVENTVVNLNKNSTLITFKDITKILGIYDHYKILQIIGLQGDIEK